MNFVSSPSGEVGSHPFFPGSRVASPKEEGKVGAASCASLAGNLKGSRVGKSAYRVFVY